MRETLILAIIAVILYRGMTFGDWSFLAYAILGVFAIWLWNLFIQQ